MVVVEVSICSGSMSYTFHPLTAQRFSSSFSRNRVPHGSARALRRNFSFSASSEGTRSTRSRTRIAHLVSRLAQPLCGALQGSFGGHVVAAGAFIFARLWLP